MPTDPQRVHALFLATAARPGVDRAAELDRACGDDTELRERVEALLRVHDLAAVTALDAVEAVGSRIGPYQLQQKLGEGGMGTVWIAEQAEPVKRRVALKVIKPGMDSAQVLRRFEQERQALALMDHSHIARVLDAGTTPQGRPYFVMELINGAAITRYCDGLQLSVRQRLQLLVAVCQAIQHAHQKGIIHRDIKPSNVLVCLQDGKPLVKVIDFGVAKAVHERVTGQWLATEIGQVIGTLEYMSPEQADLSALDIDTRTDIYALGVLLYELLTGTTPLEDRQLREASLAEAMRLIKEEEPPGPSRRLAECRAELALRAAERRTEPGRLLREVRGELDWITMKCLEKDRTRRYETANALARDLERYLADEPVDAGPPSAGYRVRKLLRRNKGKVLAAAAVALALVVGMVGTTLGLVQAEQARTLAEANAAQALASAQEERKAKDAANAAAARERLASQKAQEAANRETAARQAEQQTAAQEKKARELAQIRLAQIEKVNEMLGSIFQDLDPQAEEKGEPSLRVQLAQRLEEVARQLHGEAVGDAATVAQLQHVLGTSQLHLGNLEQAQALLEQALATRLARLGAGHPDTLASKNSLALLYQAQDKFAPAEKLFQEVVQGLAAALGADHTRTLTAQHNLATLYQSLGQYDRAEALHKEVLHKRLAQLPANHPDVLTSKNTLALLYKEQGKYSQAEPLFREVLQRRTLQLGADHPSTLTTKHNLAALYHAVGRYDLAAPLFLEVDRGRTVKLGPDHPSTLTTKHSLAEVYRVQGKLDLAEPLYLAALRGRLDKLGADHVHTLTTKFGLAELYRMQGKYAQAEALFLEAVPGLGATLGPNHLTTLAGKHSLALIYFAQHKYDQAEPLYLEVLPVQKAKLGPGHPHTLTTQQNLALLYVARAEHDRAEPLLAEGAVSARKQLGLGNALTRQLLVNLIDCYEQLKQPARAEPLCREMAAFYKQNTGAGSFAYAVQLAFLGHNLLLQRNYTDAEPVLRECWAILEQDKPGMWLTFHVQSELGGALASQRRCVSAEAHLLAGCRGLSELQAHLPSPLGQARLVEAVERLVQLYETWRKPDEAAKWRKELARVQKTTPQ
jgi:serine/threonine protein kinase/tetratricopeptide (TPR) repeat protein